ncbi:MAG: hypothetical protein NWF06_03520 [Candidatus Bathyarchaeota archaeon]|nr:hypothetical protein [Candidatus Bathyarchaeum sp.]
MKHKTFLIILFCSLLVFALLLQYSLIAKDPPKDEQIKFYVGIDVAYDNITEIQMLVDEISSYTNLVVIGCTGITYNTTQLYETCQYVYEKGFSFIVYSDMPPIMEWFVCCYVDCVNKWGEQFLGLYAFDEGCGRQLDLKTPRPFRVDEAENYTDAEEQFVNDATERLNWYKQGFNSSMNFPLYTSDYALYWFDYKAGYDVVFAEFGWNYSRQLNVALCRGAATVQKKEWGIMVTWTYNEPPYIESGEELYDDMILAYENGAKYIVIFDTNEEYTHGILEEEHLNALKRFWQYIQDNPRTNNVKNDWVAYVLPKDYGYGFRGPNDKIWGLWAADDFSLELCTNLDSLLEQYGTKLDVIYDDGLNSSNTNAYSKLIFWNGTIANR